MNSQLSNNSHLLYSGRNFFSDQDFSRTDESEDTTFYQRDRFVEHLDSLALATVEKIIGTLIVEEDPVVLDLMAGWDSHLPETVKPIQLIGLGLNERELAENKALTDRVIHDLNANPHLPFPDAYFDAVISTVSVDYMTKPVEVFREARRILKPAGLLLVIFSNRFFPEKVVKIWREGGEEERILLVEEFFAQAGGFEKPILFISKGRPRPLSDKYAHLGIPSDPIYALYADKKEGGYPKRVRPSITIEHGAAPSKEEIKRRTEAVKRTLRCPYCREKLRKWQVPQTPFTEWETEFMYVCFNDSCPYVLRGWDVMQKQGNTGLSYRFMFDPERKCSLVFPVPSLYAFRDGIVD